jgi:hypothetical protein
MSAYQEGYQLGAQQALHDSGLTKEAILGRLAAGAKNIYQSRVMPAIQKAVAPHMGAGREALKMRAAMERAALESFGRGDVLKGLYQTPSAFNPFHWRRAFRLAKSRGLPVAPPAGGAGIPVAPPAGASEAVRRAAAMRARSMGTPLSAEGQALLRGTGVSTPLKPGLF